MNRFALIAMVFLVGGAVARDLVFDASLDDLWTTWKAKFGRQYAVGSHEEHLRRSLWEKNVALIKKHNLEADLGLRSYTLGLNHISDWTPEEYKRLLGARPGDSWKFGPVSTYMSPLNSQIPDTVDWRTQGYVTPVKNQGSCGSCWSFSATGALEGQHFRKFGQLQSYAEQQLVDCSTAQGNQGCNGGWPEWAFQYVKVYSGSGGFLDIESCYPYKAVDQSCQVNTAATCNGTGATGFVDIPRYSETELTNAIANVGPISVCIDASQPTFGQYKSGVYDEPNCSSTRLDHAVLAVGYGNQNGKDYYLVKNSWGTSWGTQGYVMMRRNSANQCGIATAASYPLL